MMGLNSIFQHSNIPALYSWFVFAWRVRAVFSVTFLGASAGGCPSCEAFALFGLAADEVEHGAIEELRLLPVDRMPGLGYQRYPAVGISAAIIREIDGGVYRSAAPAINSVGSLSSLSFACVI